MLVIPLKIPKTLVLILRKEAQLHQVSLSDLVRFCLFHQYHFKGKLPRNYLKKPTETTYLNVRLPNVLQPVLSVRDPSQTFLNGLKYLTKLKSVEEVVAYGPLTIQSLIHARMTQLKKLEKAYLCITQK